MILANTIRVSSCVRHSGVTKSTLDIAWLVKSNCRYFFKVTQCVG